MVKVRQFKGVICNTLPSELASRPYDTINRREALELSGGRKNSYYRVIRPEIDLPSTVDEHDPQVYKQARNNLQQFLKEGYLTQDTEERFYAYEIEYQGITSMGIFLLARVQDYENGVIKRHELTRPDKEQDRTKIIDIQNANAEPILLTYAPQEGIQLLLQKVKGRDANIDTYLKDDDSTHRVWGLTSQESNYISEQFSQKVPALYIADGHHRMAASTNVALQRREEYQRQGIELTGEEGFEYIFAYAVSFPNLKIMPYNRMVKKIQQTPEQLLQQIQQNFIVELLEKDFDPQIKGTYSMRLDGKWYRLTPRSLDFLGENPVCDQKLDVSILQQLLITPILNIKEIRTDQNIDFLGGVLGAEGLAQKLDAEGYAVGFACYPVHIDEIVEISDKRRIMLPKATWIIPKPRSGLIARLF